MKKEKALKQLGLSDKEIAVYLSSLELGSATAQEIAHRAGIQRTYFYDLSKTLIKEKLMKKRVHGRKTLYEATSPDSLITILKSRLKEIRSIVPELKALYNPKGAKPKVYYYDGAQGISQVNDDTLNYKGEIVGFTTPRFLLFQNEKKSREYIEKRKKAGIKVRVIGGEDPAVEELKDRDWKELRETRTLPANIFSSEVELGIYGKKVFVVDYKQKYGLIIESKNLADMLKKIFEIVWSSEVILR